MENENLNVVNATQENVVDSQQTQETTKAVNAEGGEVATPQVEEKPVQSAEDNAKYAAIRREAEQKAQSKARDELIAEMYGESHGIYTYADYQKAVQAQKEQEEIANMQEDHVPEELAKEIIENRKFREQYEAEQTTRKQQDAMQKMYSEFVQAYPDVKGEEIPAEVWQRVQDGENLTKVYKEIALEKENQTLKTKIAELEGIKKAETTNQLNAAATPGSLTGNGQADTGFISFEQFEANKNDQRWVIKNLSKIQESRAKW